MIHNYSLRLLVALGNSWDDNQVYDCDYCDSIVQMLYRTKRDHTTWICEGCKSNEPTCWIPNISTIWHHEYIIDIEYALTLIDHPAYSYIREYITLQKL